MFSSGADGRCRVRGGVVKRLWLAIGRGAFEGQRVAGADARGGRPERNSVRVRRIVWGMRRYSVAASQIGGCGREADVV